MNKKMPPGVVFRGAQEGRSFNMEKSSQHDMSPSPDNTTEVGRSKPPPSITCRVVALAPDEGPNIAVVRVVGGGRLNAFSLNAATATALHRKAVGSLVKLVGKVFKAGEDTYILVEMVLTDGADVIPFPRDRA